MVRLFQCKLLHFLSQTQGMTEPVIGSLRLLFQIDYDVFAPYLSEILPPILVVRISLAFFSKSTNKKCSGMRLE
jgi:hypothetical protein